MIAATDAAVMADLIIALNFICSPPSEMSVAAARTSSVLNVHHERAPTFPAGLVGHPAGQTACRAHCRPHPSLQDRDAETQRPPEPKTMMQAPNGHAQPAHSPAGIAP
eukprot:TRINITY_DN37388_c0_g1_i1.p2 TRINITY_DN37388_c0_g1~~TRINITY_DN37388_c0_g1_i1.p2  ORF type:complete len:108 (+),score=2.76 TRINITY_DN37388_c0_g1_i1:68-391(+)